MAYPTVAVTRQKVHRRNLYHSVAAGLLAQNGAFYLVDADCVGILGDHIPWDKNRQWLDLLSKSGTALFVSCNRADEQQPRDLRAAFRTAQQPHTIVPLDWTDTKLPQRCRLPRTKLLPL